jgi:hypothetical protein
MTMWGLLAAAAALVLLAIGVVYLTVECQSLPAFLGPTKGDTAPRSGLGIVFLALGGVALVIAWFSRRQSPPANRL